jgi:hypothetical protein
MFSAHTFAWTPPNTFQLRSRFGFDGCLVKRVWAELNNTIHSANGQLFVLHCAADYNSGKDSHLLLKFLQNSKPKFKSKYKG